MESLLASYASSDEEEQPRGPLPREGRFPGKIPEPSSSSSRNSLFSALPQPKNPKASIEEDGDLEPSSARRKPSSVFSSLPPPKSLVSQRSGSISSDSGPAPPKRVVQIRLPLNPRHSYLEDDDEDDEEEREREKRKRKQQMDTAMAQDSSVKSFLSALPVPKSFGMLGALPSSGSGRRSVLETEPSTATPAMADSGGDHDTSNHENYQSVSYNDDGHYVNHGSGVDQTAENYGWGAENYYYGGYEPNGSTNVDASSYVGYDGSYGGYTGYGDQYGNSLGGGGGLEATTALPEVVESMDGAVKRARRGKKDVPAEIVEVKQDELMKNRPREDQVKLTGIAFGPAYQPASSKGKPTKLLKRKHQITALYFDMKQKEMELAERRSRGLLTKAETQAKYGW